MKIEGHAAVVTGGGSGLGEAVARELAKRVVSKDGQPAPVADFKRASRST